MPAAMAAPELHAALTVLDAEHESPFEFHAVSPEGEPFRLNYWPACWPDDERVPWDTALSVSVN